MPIPLATLVTMKNKQNSYIIQKNKYKQLMGFTVNSATEEQPKEKMKKQNTIKDLDQQVKKQNTFTSTNSQEERKKEEVKRMLKKEISKSNLSTLKDIKSVIG